MKTASNQKLKQAELDAIVIGAGFAGIYAIHKLRDQKELNVKGFERGSDVGGVWYWNRYPGARCDVESVQYAYTFSRDVEMEWDWSERYAAQPEILRYLSHVAGRFDVRRSIEFDTDVKSCVWDEKNNLWEVTTDKGETHTATYLVTAAGSLSMGKEREWPGFDKFKGEVHDTFAWPHEPVDLEGKRIGVVGTGASGVQVIQAVAKVAKQLTVFQRTPTYCIAMGNRPLTDEDLGEWRKDAVETHAFARDHTYGGILTSDPLPTAKGMSDEEVKAYCGPKMAEGGKLQLSSFADLLFNEDTNESVRKYLRGYIASKVKDPEVLEKLTPQGEKDYFFGVKRVPLETDYYECFNRDNVSLVDVFDNPIQEMTEIGLKTFDGEEHELDVLILATGFEAITGALGKIDIVGCEGRKLKDEWSEGPRAYLGLLANGFPNMFIGMGPQSPGVFYNNPLAIEDHVDFIGDAIDYLQKGGYKTIEATKASQDEWNQLTIESMQATLFPKANTWYMGVNIPGRKPSFMLYLGGAPKYRKICAEVAKLGYEGCLLSRGGVRAISEEASQQVSSITVD